jgi:hypothetical protein
VAKDFLQPIGGGREVRGADPAGLLPLPTQRFRRRAWLAFQRALDPLAPPKPLPSGWLRPKLRLPRVSG